MAPRWGHKPPKADFDKLAEAIQPGELAAAISARHKGGKSYQCPMPVHEDQRRNPTLSIWRDGDRTVGKCWGAKCMITGTRSPVQLAAAVWGVDQREAYERLAAHIGLRNGRRRDTRWRRRASPNDVTVTLPGRLLADSEVDAIGRMVYVAIAAHVAEHGDAKALTLRSITATAGCGRTAARERVRTLIERRYVRRRLRSKRAYFTVPEVRGGTCPHDGPEAEKPQGDTIKNGRETTVLSQPVENTDPDAAGSVPTWDPENTSDTRVSDSSGSRDDRSQRHSQPVETEGSRDDDAYTVGWVGLGSGNSNGHVGGGGNVDGEGDGDTGRRHAPDRRSGTLTGASARSLPVVRPPTSAPLVDLPDDRCPVTSLVAAKSGPPVISAAEEQGDFGLAGARREIPDQVRF